MEHRAVNSGKHPKIRKRDTNQNYSGHTDWRFSKLDENPQSGIV